MRKIIIIIIISLCLLTQQRALAQSTTALSAVEVDLWPEFDRPSLLVIYRITLSAQSTLPAQLMIRIPADAGAPNAVAVRQLDGTLMNIPFDQQTSGDWTQLTFDAPAQDIQVEYYDPGLTKNGTARHFEYQWPGDYDVQSFTIQVQQPVGATEMRFSPSLGPGRQGADGLVYYIQEIGALSSGQSFSIVLDYQKSNDELSSSQVPVDASGPLDTTTPGRQSMVSALPWLLGLLGLFLILGGGLWYWQSGRNSAKPLKVSIPRRRKTNAQSEVKIIDEDYVYCHQCGKRASPGDRFCRACGTELRLS
jgi:hypothetical protein